VNQVHRIHIALSEEEYALLRQASQEDGRSMSSFIRKLIRILEVPAPPERPAKDVLEDIRRIWRQE